MASTPKFLRWGPYDSWQEWLRGLGITLVGAAFLAYAEAFGSARLSIPVRYAYWFGLMFVGWLWGVSVANFFFGKIRRPQRLWLRILISSLVISIPYSVVVGVASSLTRGSSAYYVSAAGMAEILFTTLLISAVMILLNVLVARQAGGVTSASAQPPKFLERLPAKLNGAEVWAVEAEDHYLRLHTSQGQDLILMRLSDAVAELQGIEGAQVHRSWWVARSAIAEAVRGDGRATLTLRDGAEVPVSRTYARLLRQSGWI
ncbi:LytTR family DNA-binding domain-containing protein [Phenylobacterium sp.]|uniref:LytTR family DNA-binding domain-containing protein n=1 Tax=Phenylobacterium sp. TaxID=1871053 RepID=UPI002BFEFD00|nr:LytTR family DNA-binding domain-containing protein [Phenylobacterium sp.]HLZ74346.1 LytTR family DNA-binding domain-containing protein [Phenylobacterium sp.]